MNEIRVGIIGIGNMGTAHANNIYAGNIKGMKLAAVCDIRKVRRDFCTEAYKDVAVFENGEEMIKSGLIDLLIVAVPHYYHTDYVETALKNGLHALTEKPADVLASRAKSIHELAKKSGKVFGIMFNQRTNPLFAKAREIVQSGALGELKRSVWIITNWYRTQSYYDSGEWRATWAGEGGGVLLNQAPHNLDLWQWICGMPVKLRAFCEQGKYHNIEVEDDATLFATYANGATGTFITTTGEYPGTNRLEISGDLGKIVLEEGVLKWWKLGVPERKFCFESAEGFAQIPCEYVEIRPDEPETGHSGILQNLANAILYGEELLAPGYDGIKELTLSNAAYLSSWCGNKEIALPFDEQTVEEFAAELKKRADASNYKENAVLEKMSGEYSKRWQVRW